jgi:hypothetical protein
VSRVRKLALAMGPGVLAWGVLLILEKTLSREAS